MIKEETVNYVLELIDPKIEYLLSLEKKVKLIDALKVMKFNSKVLILQGNENNWRKFEFFNTWLSWYSWKGWFDFESIQRKKQATRIYLQ